MPTLMERGLSQLGRRLQTAAGGAIQWTVGRVNLRGNAVFGRSEYQIDSGSDVRILHTDRDFIVTRADFVIGGAPVEPVPGQKIVDLATLEVFELMPLGSAPCYRPCDPYGKIIRLHAKKIA